MKRLCRVVEVSRSGYYRWRAAAGARAGRALSDAELTGRIREIHTEWDGTYGSPRITAALRAEGRRVNHKRVERVMREAGIVGVHLRKRCGWCPGGSETPGHHRLHVGVLSAGRHASSAVMSEAYTRATLWLYWMVYIDLAPVTTVPLEAKKSSVRAGGRVAT